LHVYPDLGDRELRRLSPSVVQAWVRGLQGRMAANYVRVVFANLSAMLTAAVDDGKIAKNPCSAASVKPPAAERRRVAPWSAEQVAAVRAALPARYRAVVDAAGGCGLRQGEVFGLAVEDVDWLRGVVHVRRQVKIVGAQLVFAPPKGGKERDVPLAETVSLRLAAHLAAYPAVPVTLPWREPSGQPQTVRLIFTSRERGACNRNYVNTCLWKPALEAAGVAPTRENGMHALRHWYASVQLDAGTSVKALAEHLGHVDPGFTLRVYTHLLPASEDRSRKAVDRALGGGQDAVNGSAGTAGGAPDVRRADR
jgi:integrase